jgi:hypothetical protein
MAYITFQPKDHFNTVAWTGTSSSPLNVTGYGFQPDWVWNKYRAGAGDHQVYDAVRGATKMLIPNSSNAESTNANGVTAFITDGFTAGSDINVNGGNSVAWGWKANGQGSANTDGTINTTYTSANTTAGFSICKWTGTGSAGTIGHGLGAVPSMIIFKNLDGSSSRLWAVYHKGAYVSASDPNILYLNNTSTEADDTNVLGTSVTLSSSVFSVGDYSGSNYSGEDIIAYVFAEKQGFSKFGRFTGTGSSNGPFIYTGFKPAFIITRRASGATGDWQLYDNKRTPFNVADTILFPNGNTADSQADGYAMDILSNGFKIRSDNPNKNNSGSKYIFMAFAEMPFVGSNDTPATAR